MIRFFRTLRRARAAFASLEYALVTGGLVLVFVAFAVASSGVLERSLEATETDLSQPDSLDARVGVVEVPATTVPVAGLSLAEATLPIAVYNTPYTFDFGSLVSGASGPLSWSNVGAPLPAGFALSPTTGVLAGTYAGTLPETASLTIAVGDGTASVQRVFSLSLLPEAMVLSPATLPTVVADQPYAFDLTSLAQVPASVLAQDIVWSITGGTLPAGLSLDPNTGVVSGTYTGLTSAAAVVTVQGAVGAFLDTETYSFTAQGAGLRLMPFGPIAIQAGVPVGLDASLLLEADPALDLGPLVWSIFPVDGGGQPVAWPAGIATSGPSIFGTPTAVQSADYTVRVTATLGTLSATREYSAPYTGAGVDLVAASPSIPSARANLAYSHDLGQWLARDTTAPAPTWSITAGTLPSGLSLNATTGVVSGMYTALEDDTEVVTVRAALPDGRADEQAYTFVATGAGAVATAQVLPTASFGVAYSFDLRNTLTTRQPFDLASLTWTVSGSPLPAGLSINTATGIISGTHFAAQSANLSILVVATDGNNVTATAVHTLPIVGSALAAGGTIQGTGANDFYGYYAVHPSVSIQENNTGGTDTLRFFDLNLSDMISVARGGTFASGTDANLVFTTPDGDTVTLNSFYSSVANRRIENVVFANGATYTLDQMMNEVAARTMASGGLVYGTWRNDVYTVPSSGPDTTIRELGTSGTDTVVFQGVSSSQVLVSAVNTSGDLRNLSVRFPSGRVVTLQGVTTDPVNAPSRLESFTFTDGTFTPVQLFALQHAAAFASGGTAVGSFLTDTFTVPSVGPSATIFENGSSSGAGNDTVVFPIPSTSAVLSRTGSSLSLNVGLGGGRNILVTDIWQSGAAAVRQIELFSFSNGVTWTREQISQQYLLQAIASSATTVVGTPFSDTYTHNRAFGSRTFSDGGTDGGGDDTLFMNDVASTEVAWSRSGFSIVMTFGGQTVSISNQTRAGAFYHIDRVTFSNGVTVTRSEMLALAP